MRRHSATLAFGLVASACVVGTERPPSRLDIARGPVDEPPPVSNTGSFAGCSGERPAPPPRSGAGTVFIDGYCHFDGARYVFVPGHWEPAGERSR